MVSRATSRIDRDPEVRRMAEELGVKGPDLQAKLCATATRRVADSLTSLGIEPTTLDEVHAFVLNITRVNVVRVQDDDDLRRVSAELAKKQPLLPKQLELEFGATTEALVVRHEGDPRQAAFTAVVDARGNRRSRAWFAERHEPAHLLVPDPGGRVAWRRTTVERPEPVEQVIDAIASEVGFWGPIVRPVVERCLRDEGDVFAAFDRARQELAPDASREASYRAFVRFVPYPLAIVFAADGARAADIRAGTSAASMALRVQVVIVNEPARALGLMIPTNYRIPSHSIVHQSCVDPTFGVHCQEDCLGLWTDSSGRSLPPRVVHITARGGWAAVVPA